MLSDENRRTRYDALYQANQSRSEAGPTTSGFDDHRRDDGYRNDAWEEPQYEESQSARDAEPEKVYYTEEARAENVLSLAFLKYLLSMLADRLTPRPDERQRILPWPSLKWQRLWLFASVPMNGLLVFLFGAQGVWIIAGSACALIACSIYSGRETSWLKETTTARAPAKIAGGTAIALSVISYAFMAFMIALVVALLIIGAMAAFAMIRAMFEQQLGGRR